MVQLYPNNNSLCKFSIIIFCYLQVSISPSCDDKFTLLLTQLHNCLAGVLEVSLADEVGRHVDEITGYLTVTMNVDASGALLCIQQVGYCKFLHKNFHKYYNFTCTCRVFLFLFYHFSCSIIFLVLSLMICPENYFSL